MKILFFLLQIRYNFPVFSIFLYQNNSILYLTLVCQHNFNILNSLKDISFRCMHACMHATPQPSASCRHLTFLTANFINELHLTNEVDLEINQSMSNQFNEIFLCFIFPFAVILSCQVSLRRSDRVCVCVCVRQLPDSCAPGSFTFKSWSRSCYRYNTGTLSNSMCQGPCFRAPKQVCKILSNILTAE